MEMIVLRWESVSRVCPCLMDFGYAKFRPVHYSLVRCLMPYLRRISRELDKKVGPGNWRVWVTFGERELDVNILRHMADWSSWGRKKGGFMREYDEWVRAYGQAMENLAKEEMEGEDAADVDA